MNDTLFEKAEEAAEASLNAAVEQEEVAQKASEIPDPSD